METRRGAPAAVRIPPSIDWNPHGAFRQFFSDPACDEFLWSAEVNGRAPFCFKLSVSFIFLTGHTDYRNAQRRLEIKPPLASIKKDRLPQPARDLHFILSPRWRTEETLLALISSRCNRFPLQLVRYFDLCMKSQAESLAAACRGESSKHRGGQQVSPGSSNKHPPPPHQKHTHAHTHTH